MPENEERITQIKPDILLSTHIVYPAERPLCAVVHTKPEWGTAHSGAFSLVRANEHKFNIAYS